MKAFYILLICCFSVVFAIAQEKCYEISSAQIQYTITGSGNMMGMATKISGNASLLFTDYGQKEISNETIVQTMMGQKETTKTMTKVDGDTIYSVDFEEKTINTMSLEDFAQYSQKKGKNAMEQMGAKKLGTQKVLGYTCENWEFQGSQICFYKGIELKSTSTVMGLNQTKIATQIDINPKITKQSFVLPNFKTQRSSAAQQGMPSTEEMNIMLDSIQNMYGN